MDDHSRLAAQIDQVDAALVGPEYVDAQPSPLEPLWLALFDHHLSAGAAGMQTVARDVSWPLRRAHYRRLLAGQPSVSLWIARIGERPVGYALSFEDELDGARAEVLESLSLLPETRGQGVGPRLIAAVDESARSRGIDLAVVDVLGGNARARSFYLREGYVPYSATWMRNARIGDMPPLAGNVSAHLTALEALHLSARVAEGPDDTWVGGMRILELSALQVRLADAGERQCWLDELFDRLRGLESDGYVTVWIEVDAGQDWISTALEAAGFALGMERLTRATSPERP